MFLYRWSTQKSSQTFEEFAQRLFTRKVARGQKLLPKLQGYLNCWIADGKYDSNAIELCFKEIFGADKALFGSGASRLSGTKVAITTTSTSDSTGFLLTNYNAAKLRPNDLGNNLVLPVHTEDC